MKFFTRRRKAEKLRATIILVVVTMILTVLLFIFAGGAAVLGDIFGSHDRFDAEIAAAAKKHSLPPALVKALILKESSFRSLAVGRSGEIGLMQLMPAGKPGAVGEWSRLTASPAPSRRELFDVRTNLDIGCWFLSRAYYKWAKYRCRTELALAEYNAGASRSARWKPETPDGEFVSRIDIASTREYVKFIMKHYHRYRDAGKP